MLCWRRIVDRKADRAISMQGDFLLCWTQSLKKCHVWGKWPETLWKQQKSTAAVCDELLYLSRDGVVSRSRNLHACRQHEESAVLSWRQESSEPGQPRQPRDLLCQPVPCVSAAAAVQGWCFAMPNTSCPWPLAEAESGIPRLLSRRYASLLPGYSKMMAWFWMMFGTGNLSLRKNTKSACAKFADIIFEHIPFYLYVHESIDALIQGSYSSGLFVGHDVATLAGDVQAEAC